MYIVNDNCEHVLCQLTVVCVLCVCVCVCVCVHVGGPAVEDKLKQKVTCKLEQWCSGDV
jgi:hypothetical protein